MGLLRRPGQLRPPSAQADVAVLLRLGATAGTRLVDPRPPLETRLRLPLGRGAGRSKKERGASRERFAPDDGGEPSHPIAFPRPSPEARPGRPSRPAVDCAP